MLQQKQGHRNVLNGALTTPLLCFCPRRPRVLSQSLPNILFTVCKPCRACCCCRVILLCQSQPRFLEFWNLSNKEVFFKVKSSVNVHSVCYRLMPSCSNISLMPVQLQVRHKKDTLAQTHLDLWFPVHLLFWLVDKLHFGKVFKAKLVTIQCIQASTSTVYACITCLVSHLRLLIFMRVLVCTF